MKKLELTDKQKEVASRASKMAADGAPNPEFWNGVAKEVDRLHKKIKPRNLRD